MAEASEESTEAPDFDTRLDRLESLVVELERGGLGLEGSIARYQEGIELLKSCRETLGGYKKRVEELGAGADEALRAFDDDPDFDGADPRA